MIFVILSLIVIILHNITLDLVYFYLHHSFRSDILAVYSLYRFGLGDFDWSEFIPRMKQKTPEEIKEYVP